MRLHPSIVSLLLIGCDPTSPQQQPPMEDLRGRVALSWTLDGAFLTADRCKAERIEYMEVEVREVAGGGVVDYTQVQCDIDRYSLDMTPLGRVVLRVGGMGTDSRGQECLRRYGEAAATATTSFPVAPTAVDLKSISGGCR